MWLINTVLAAFSMFTALPVPQVKLNENSTRYLLCAFPLTGALQALAWLMWAYLCARVAIPAMLCGAVFAVLPYAVTGGIHIDGYMDTSDALASHADRERKQAILRDPHCGAFAVLRVCVYYILYVALCMSADLTERALYAAALSFLLSRALSALMLTCLPLAPASGMARMFADTKEKGRVRVILLLELCMLTVLMLLAGGGYAAAACVAATCMVAHYALCALHTFGATSGDLAGWFLVRAEFWMLAAICIVQIWEGRIG